MTTNLDAAATGYADSQMLIMRNRLQGEAYPEALIRLMLAQAYVAGTLECAKAINEAVIRDGK